MIDSPSRGATLALIAACADSRSEQKVERLEDDAVLRVLQRDRRVPASGALLRRRRLVREDVWSWSGTISQPGMWCEQDGHKDD